MRRSFVRSYLVALAERGDVRSAAALCWEGTRRGETGGGLQVVRGGRSLPAGVGLVEELREAAARAELMVVMIQRRGGGGGGGGHTTKMRPLCQF